MFLGILAHDLRNPLGAIMNSVELLKRTEGANAREVSLFRQILTSALRMERMVTDLLELTRVRLGKGIIIQCKMMDMKQIADEALAEMKALYPDRDIILESSGDMNGCWDAARMSQVLSNLTGNAVQHGKPGTPVTIRMQGNTDKVVIKVHNQGTIPESDLGNIFDSFVQGAPDEETARHSKSLGLGLFISKEIVLAHGGTIKARSSAEEGTTFTVCVPREIRN
jgi:signal transduction histidine kinase